jgi:cell division protein ZipA
MSSNLIYLKILAASNQSFVGYEFLQAIIDAGFTFSEIDLLHYYGEDKKNREPLFSLTSAIEPKIFDLKNIGQWSCTGLILFMELNLNKDLNQTLNLMIETAKQLAENLHGVLIDDQKQPVTSDTISRWQTIISHFIAHKKNRELF